MTKPEIPIDIDEKEGERKPDLTPHDIPIVDQSGYARPSDMQKLLAKEQRDAAKLKARQEAETMEVPTVPSSQEE